MHGVAAGNAPGFSTAANTANRPRLRLSAAARRARRVSILVYYPYYYPFWAYDNPWGWGYPWGWGWPIGVFVGFGECFNRGFRGAFFHPGFGRFGFGHRAFRFGADFGDDHDTAVSRPAITGRRGASS
jgi:hypothetical protein